MSCTVIIKDKNLKPENIKKGVTILKVKGTLEGGSAEPVLQDVSLSYAENGTYTISASEGYDGLGTVDLSVNVNTQPNLQNASVTYVSNGNYTVSASSGYDGLGTVDVSVNIDGVTNWIVETKAGRLTDISGYSIADLVGYSGGAAGLFMYSNITTLPRIQDPVDNPDAYVGFSSLRQTFQGCLHLQSVDMSVGGTSDNGMLQCFSESGVRDASIDVSVLYNNASSVFSECFYNCQELRNLYIHLGPQAHRTAYNTFSDMCYNAGNAWNNNDNTTITIEGLEQVSSGAFNNAFGGMHSSNSGGITVNLPDNLSTISGTTIWNAFSNMFAYAKFTDPTTPSFLGKLNYIVGSGNFSSALVGTNIESATLGFNDLIGDNNFENMFSDCQYLRAVTFDGSFGIAGNYNFNYAFQNCYNLTSMTCTSTAGTLPFHDNTENNVAITALYITDVTIDNVNSDVCLLWNPSVNKASVYGILSKAVGATVQQGDYRKIEFYDGGLTVEDYQDGRIQTAYDAAVADGWTVYNLTITPYS